MLEMGERELGTELFFLQKIAQVLAEWFSEHFQKS
jgi:hypothetical protein